MSENRWVQDFMLQLGILCLLVSASIALLAVAYGHYIDVTTPDGIDCVIQGDRDGRRA